MLHVMTSLVNKPSIRQGITTALISWTDMVFIDRITGPIVRIDDGAVLTGASENNADSESFAINNSSRWTTASEITIFCPGNSPTKPHSELLGKFLSQITLLNISSPKVSDVCGDLGKS